MKVGGGGNAEQKFWLLGGGGGGGLKGLHQRAGVNWGALKRVGEDRGVGCVTCHLHPPQSEVPGVCHGLTMVHPRLPPWHRTWTPQKHGPQPHRRLGMGRSNRNRGLVGLARGEEGL